MKLLEHKEEVRKEFTLRCECGDETKIVVIYDLTNGELTIPQAEHLNCPSKKIEKKEPETEEAKMPQINFS